MNMILLDENIRIAKSLKLIATFLLLFSFTLPLSTCTYYEDSYGKRVEVEDEKNIPEDVYLVVEKAYVMDRFDHKSILAWLSVFAFIWPSLTILALRIFPHGKLSIFIRALEIVLIPGSIFIIFYYALDIFDDPAAGWYLANFSLGIYAVGAIWLNILVFLGWKRKNKILARS